VSGGGQSAGSSRPVRPVGPGGLCPNCRHVRIVRAPGGSTFLLCELSRKDPAYRRYPAQPRMVCAGFEP
jgi:hypothetical protein